MAGADENRQLCARCRASRLWDSKVKNARKGSPLQDKRTRAGGGAPLLMETCLGLVSFVSNEARLGYSMTDQGRNGLLAAFWELSPLRRPSDVGSESLAVMQSRCWREA
uniref:Uncharacterized protein n=1 Tax=Piliocolobus tephrosceles TaxID=591936 RepID=A0A8C9GD38_9PRIM